MPPVRTSSITSQPSTSASTSTIATQPNRKHSNSIISNGSATHGSPLYSNNREESPSPLLERDPSSSNSKMDGSSKQQKACIHCRKSKVKCVNEGGPPCRRCLDGNLECKFRLRADDENWREKTDETLSKLSDAVDALLHRDVRPTAPSMHHQGTHAMSPPQASSSGHHPYIHHQHHHHHPYAHPNYHSQSMPPPPHLPSPRAPGNVPPASVGHHHHHHQHAYSPPNGPQTHPTVIRSSPHSDHSSQMDYLSKTSPHNPPPLPRTLSGPAAMMIAGSQTNGIDHRPHDPSSGFNNHHHHAHRRSSTTRSQDGLLVPSMSMGPHSPIAIAGPYTPGVASGSGGSRNSSSSNSGGMNYTPQPLPTTQSLAVGYNYTAPADFLRHVTTDSTPFFLTNPLPMRWTSGVPASQSYGAPVAYIGRDDPRLTCISRSLIPLEKVRGLFIFFSERMQPHSFGFPSFPPTEYMTPLIISAISMVSSLHEQGSRQHHAILKADVKAAIPEDGLYEGKDLDPELGIGVEEITAVCIASSWLGGDEAYSLARLARWWSLAYLKQFDSQHHSNADGTRSVTLGEALTILPPFRQIDLASRLRIWLEAFIVDAHQAFMHDKSPMASRASASYYCEALRSCILANPASSAAGIAFASGSSSAGSRLGLHDRQLIGHASLMEILLDVQRVERYHVQSLQQHQQQHGTWGAEAMRGLEELVARRLADLLAQVDAVDRWRERIRKDEDLSSANPASMDLSFTYLLTRCYIGSLALTIDLSFLSSSAPSMSAAQLQSPGLFSDVTQAGPSASSPEQDWPHSILSQGTTLINSAKENALSALDLACERKGRGFGDRIVAMPTWYHFLLSHVVGFLLQLVQRKNCFLLSREARSILSKVESFVQQYVFEITSHGYISAEALATASGSSSGSGHANGHSNSNSTNGNASHQPEGQDESMPHQHHTNGSSSHTSPPQEATGSSPTTNDLPKDSTMMASVGHNHTAPSASGTQTPHSGVTTSTSLIPRNIIPGADHPAKIMARSMAKAVAHLKAQSKG
ncbi:unnamed protein product [Sympodiomycopsis kandeliae]